MTGQLLVRLETELPNGKYFVLVLSELREHSNKLKLSFTTAHIDRIIEYSRENAGKIPIKDFGIGLHSQVKELLYRISDELGDRFFLSLDKDSVPYYRQSEPLFGLAVERRFPSASEDISEAGKCLGLGRSTASVFHLMRAMELAVVEIGRLLGVTVVDQNNVDLEWGKNTW
jgi:hypothetical protein